MLNSTDNNMNSMNPSNSNSSFTLEDRHSLSDPRPIPNLKLPTWEVDVYREGVDVPIMTLRVDSTVLPPRKNKKKKVQWKLPDSIKTLPKFGEQERRRVLELFREKKKELKKLKNKQRAYRRASSMESMNDDSNSNGGEATAEYNNCNGSGGGDDNVNINGVNNGSNLDAAKKVYVVEGLPPEIHRKAQQQQPKQQRKQKQKQYKQKQGSDNVDIIIVSSDDSVLASSSKKIDGGDGGDGAPSPPGFGHSSKTSLPPPPPGIPSSSTLKPAPPGLPSKNNLYSSSSTNDWNATGYKNGYSSSSSTSSSTSSPSPPIARNLQRMLPAQNGQHQRQHHNRSQNGMQNSFAPPAPGIMNGHNHSHRHNNCSIKAQIPIAPPMAIGPCFVLPPNAPQGSTIGKFVTETYYLSLRNGLIRELDAYYYHSGGSNGSITSSTDVARVCKAVTVGGAHAICTSQQDRLMQLNTFAGTEMRIKGVQEQPTAGNGILVLITGVSIRNNNNINNGSPQPQQQQLHPPQQLPFCHTLVLTPVSTVTAQAAALMDSIAPMNTTDSTIGYQILNDNLVILTADE